jgi:hypothetical protein
MHQRYFYPQDLLSLVIVFFQPELWFLPIISQIVSVLAYGPFLFNKSFQITFLGAKYNTLLFVGLPLEVILLAVVLWKQFHQPKQAANAGGRVNEPMPANQNPLPAKNGG